MDKELKFVNWKGTGDVEDRPGTSSSRHISKFVLLEWSNAQW